MIRRFWPLLVIAFVVGSLFRLYTDTGIGFYRMFGTLGIVVLGAVASRLIVAAQVDEGEDYLRKALATLPDDFDVWRVSPKVADRIVVGPAGAVVLVASTIAHYARGWGLKRSLEQLLARVERVAEVARRQVEKYGAEDGGAHGETRPVYRAAVFLRRQPRVEDRVWLAQYGIDAITVDEVLPYVESRGYGMAHDPWGGGDPPPEDSLGDEREEAEETPEGEDHVRHEATSGVSPSLEGEEARGG